MNPPSALPQYRLATQQLSGLSPKQQVLVLKLELWLALQREIEFQRRARELELRVARLEQPAREREAILDAFARKLHVDLVSKTRELEALRRERDGQVGGHRFALLVAKKHCERLEDCLQDLIAGLKLSNRPHLPDGPSEAPQAPQEIAS